MPLTACTPRARPCKWPFDVRYSTWWVPFCAKKWHSDRLTVAARQWRPRSDRPSRWGHCQRKTGRADGHQCRDTPRCACPAPRSRSPALHWQPRERCHTTLLANAPEPFVAGRHLRSEPLRCWALVEHQDGSTSLEGLVRDEEWLSEPGGAEFPKAIRGPHAHVGYASATAGLGHSGSRAA